MNLKNLVYRRFCLNLSLPRDRSAVDDMVILTREILETKEEENEQKGVVRGP